MSGFIDNERFRKLLIARPEKAIEILYEKYYHALIVIAERLVHDRNAAEDIVQETFIHLWERHRKLGRPDERSIEHYLIKVVRNRAITYYNKHNRRRNIESGDLNGDEQSEISTEARLIKLEFSREIRNIIMTFPQREKQCLLMRMDEEITTRQIADRLHVTRKAVERSLTSAYKRLRQCLKRKGYTFSARRHGAKRSSPARARIGRDI